MEQARRVPAKPVRWMGSVKADLTAFPAEVKWRVGCASGTRRWASRRLLRNR